VTLPENSCNECARRTVTVGHHGQPFGMGLGAQQGGDVVVDSLDLARVEAEPT